MLAATLIGVGRQRIACVRYEFWATRRAFVHDTPTARPDLIASARIRSGSCRMAAGSTVDGVVQKGWAETR
jgi:hypothetical protein